VQVRVGVFKHAIEVFQSLAKFAGSFSIQEVIQNGLIVLVDEHHHALAVNTPCIFKQTGKVVCNAFGRRCFNIQLFPLLLKLIADVGI